jgi:aspartyl-tRNA synthetase
MSENKRIYTDQLKDFVGQTVTISGFAHAIRNQGSIRFILLRDLKGISQCVVLKNSAAFTVAEELSLESVIKVTGLAKQEKQAPGGYEVEAQSIEILSKALPLPIPVVVEKSGDEVDMAKRFDNRWLDLRREESLKIFKVWTALEKGFRSHVSEGDYVQVYGPSFMNSPSESGSEVFEVKYFDRKAYLAQSPQFYKQMAMAAGFEKVFMTGPVFRAEPSYTTRHMTEFTGWDFEISYIESHHDVMDELEMFLVSGFEEVHKTGLVEVEVPTRPFPRITMSEAKKLLRENQIPSEKEHDLSPEEERALAKIVKEKFNHDFVFLIDWHKSIRPFYHMRHADNAELTKSFDLLYRGLEIVTGAQREHRYEVLIEQAKEKGMDLEQLNYYIDFFRYGCPPHGGIGLGPGRVIMQLMGLSSVKEATFLPRDVKRLTP